MVSIYEQTGLRSLLTPVFFLCVFLLAFLVVFIDFFIFCSLLFHFISKIQDNKTDATVEYI